MRRREEELKHGPAFIEKPAFAAPAVTLIREAGVFDLALPCGSRACVRDEALALASIPRSLALSFKTTRVHAADAQLSLTPGTKDGDRLLIHDPAVPAPRYRIAQLPLKKRSVGVESLKISECKNFLREAEAVKGIPAGQAELLAVFRNVPIEIISRLRYVAAAKSILYSMSARPSPKSTRLHDMAAVRNTCTREIYLIAHRTRFRAVDLNECGGALQPARAGR